MLTKLLRHWGLHLRQILQITSIINELNFIVMIMMSFLRELYLLGQGISVNNYKEIVICVFIRIYQNIRREFYFKQNFISKRSTKKHKKITYITKTLDLVFKEGRIRILELEEDKVLEKVEGI